MIKRTNIKLAYILTPLLLLLIACGGTPQDSLGRYGEQLAEYDMAVEETSLLDDSADFEEDG